MKHAIRLLFVMPFLVAVSTTAEEQGVDLADIEPPPGYEPYGEENLYVRFGDGVSALRQSIPDHEFDAEFLDDWFFDGIVAVMEVSSLVVPDGMDTDLQVHESLASSLAASWGEYSFSVYDPETRIGRFVNYAGAFVAVSWRISDENIIVVESQDLAEVLVVESVAAPASSDPAVLWQHYRKAANAADVDGLLLALELK